MSLSSEVGIIVKTVGVPGDPFKEYTVLENATPSREEAQKLAELDFNSKLHWMSDDNGNLAGFAERDGAIYWYRIHEVWVHHETPCVFEEVL